MKREWPLRIPCTEPGCIEAANYRYDTKRDMLESFELKHRAKYKCTRHSKGAGLLTLANTKVEWTSDVSRQESYGRFFGNYGVIVGHGYYVAAKDFPAGTRVKITCEVLLPSDQR